MESNENQVTDNLVNINNDIVDKENKTPNNINNSNDSIQKNKTDSNSDILMMKSIENYFENNDTTKQDNDEILDEDLIDKKKK